MKCARKVKGKNKENWSSLMENTAKTMHNKKKSWALLHNTSSNFQASSNVIHKYQFEAMKSQHQAVGSHIPNKSAMNKIVLNLSGCICGVNFKAGYGAQWRAVVFATCLGFLSDTFCFVACRGGRWELAWACAESASPRQFAAWPQPEETYFIPSSPNYSVYR